MRTVMAFGQEEYGTLQRQEAEAPRRLTTTLYDLMAVIQAVVGPDDTQVVRTVVHLLQSGQLTFLGQGDARARWPMRAATPMASRLRGYPPIS